VKQRNHAVSIADRSYRPYYYNCSIPNGHFFTCLKKHSVAEKLRWFLIWTLSVTTIRLLFNTKFQSFVGRLYFIILYCICGHIIYIACSLLYNNDTFHAIYRYHKYIYIGMCHTTPFPKKVLVTMQLKNNIMIILYIVFV